MLDKKTKYKAQERAAYGLMLIEAHITGQFLTEVQEFTGNE